MPKRTAMPNRLIQIIGVEKKRKNGGCRRPKDRNISGPISRISINPKERNTAPITPMPPRSVQKAIFLAMMIHRGVGVIRSFFMVSMIFGIAC